MKKLIPTTFAAALAAVTLLAPTTIWAEEGDSGEGASEGQSTRNAAMKEFADLGTGVHKPKLNVNNTLVSCIIVGQAPISKAFGKARGIVDAKKKAKLAAEAAFVSWMKTVVSDIRQSGETTEVHINAGALDENGEPIEQGQRTETSSQITTAQAQGQLRGMRQMGIDQDAEQGLMTLVFTWKPEYAAAAAGAAGAMNTPDAEPGKPAPTGIDGDSAGGGSGRGSAGAPGSGASGKPKVEIPSRTNVDKDLDEFL